MIIVRIIRLLRKKRKWRKMNPHNTTFIKRAQYLDQLEVGKYTYGELNVESFANIHKVKIGNYVSIARNVTFVIDAGHYTDHVSTFPFKVKLMKEKMEAISKGDIVVDDDVWIGYSSIILSGVHIGQGAVIAAGAVVSKDVPPYSIVGGIPAEVIKYRFSSEMISELLKIDYSKLTEEQIIEHIDGLYEGLTDVRQLDWMPRK